MVSAPAPITYWKIPREWPESTIFILGAGPSLKGFDFEQLRGRRVIAINRMFRLAPFADVLYFCDRGWWVLDGAEVREKFVGQYIITVGKTQDPLIKNIRNTGTAGLELTPYGVKHGTNSGYQAINLAYHFGARRIVLMGFDMSNSADNQTHVHGGYGTDATIMRHIFKERMLPFFQRLVEPLAAAGVEVVNASPDSALHCWPKITLGEAVRL